MFRCIVALFSAMLIGLGANLVLAQTYPNKPIRLVAGAVGGGTDLEARLIAQEIAVALRQPVLVENRSGILPFEIVARASPDGYTLLVASSPFFVGPLLRKTTYDPVTDYAPITLVSVPPNILVVHPSVTAASVRELIALGKADPGKLNYGSSGVGTSPHLAAELFKVMAGVNIVHVPYSGGGPAVIGLLGAQVHLMFATGPSSTSHVKAGKLRALAITSARPSVLLPGLPTMAASGLPGYEYAGLDAVFAPARTPNAIINRLNQEILRALSQADIKEKFFATGTEIAGSSSKELGVLLKSEIDKTRKLIQDAGVKAD